MLSRISAQSPQSTRASAERTFPLVALNAAALPCVLRPHRRALPAPAIEEQQVGAGSHDERAAIAELEEAAYALDQSRLEKGSGFGRTKRQDNF